MKNSVQFTFDHDLEGSSFCVLELLSKQLHLISVGELSQHVELDEGRYAAIVYLPSGSQLHATFQTQDGNNKVVRLPSAARSAGSLLKLSSTLRATTIDEATPLPMNINRLTSLAAEIRLSFSIPEQSPSTIDSFLLQVGSNKDEQINITYPKVFRDRHGQYTVAINEVENNFSARAVLPPTKLGIAWEYACNGSATQSTVLANSISFSDLSSDEEVLLAGLLMIKLGLRATEDNVLKAIEKIEKSADALIIQGEIFARRGLHSKSSDCFRAAASFVPAFGYSLEILCFRSSQYSGSEFEFDHWAKFQIASAGVIHNSVTLTYRIQKPVSGDLGEMPQSVDTSTESTPILDESFTRYTMKALDEKNKRMSVQETLESEIRQRLRLLLLEEPAHKTYVARTTIKVPSNFFYFSQSRSNFSRYLSYEDDKLDAAKRQIGKGNSNAALRMLAGIDDSKLSPLGHVRVAVNKGICHLMSEHLADAEQQFKQGLDIDENSPIAQINFAQAKLLQGETAVAYQYSVRALKTKSAPDYLAVHLVVLYADKRRRQLAEFLWKHRRAIQKSSSCLSALGQNAMDDKRPSKAEYYFRQSISVNPKNAQTYYQCALSIYVPTAENVMENPPTHGNYSKSVRQNLQSVIELLEVTIELLRNGDLTHQLSKALVFKGAVYAALGRRKESYMNFNEALSLEPENAEAIFNIAKFHILQDQPQKAVELLERLARSSDNITVLEMLGEAYCRMGRYGDALVPLRKVVGLELTNSPMYFHTYDRLLEAEYRLGNGIEVEKLTQNLMALFESKKDGPRYVLAKHWKRQGNLAMAEAFYVAAAMVANESMRFWITREHAQFVFDEAQKTWFQDAAVSKALFEKSAILLQQIISSESDSPEYREYIAAIANAGHLEAAGELARKLRESIGEVMPVISEIEAQAAAKAGDLQRVLLLLNQLVKIEPNNVRAKANLLSIYRRMGRVESLTAALSTAVHSNVQNIGQLVAQKMSIISTARRIDEI